MYLRKQENSPTENSPFAGSYNIIVFIQDFHIIYCIFVNTYFFTNGKTLKSRQTNPSFGCISAILKIVNKCIQEVARLAYLSYEKM